MTYMLISSTLTLFFNTGHSYGLGDVLRTGMSEEDCDGSSTEGC